MLNINDLNTSKELNKEEMAGVKGGMTPTLSLFSPTSVPSFSEQGAATGAFGGPATNVNAMINAATNNAGQGSQIVAPVFMSSDQSNDNDVVQGLIQAAIQSSF